MSLWQVCLYVCMFWFLSFSYDERQHQGFHRSAFNHYNSYDSSTSGHSLLGVTIGELLQKQVERVPDREMVIFSRDGIRLTFSQFKEKVRFICNMCVSTMAVIVYSFIFSVTAWLLVYSTWECHLEIEWVYGVLTMWNGCCPCLLQLV